MGLRVPNQGVDGGRQRERTQRRRREPRGELSFLVNGLSPWKRIDRSEGWTAGKAPRLTGRPVRSRRPMKIWGSGSASRLAVLETAAGLQGE